jgi:hypothetical protein
MTPGANIGTGSVVEVSVYAPGATALSCTATGLSFSSITSQTDGYPALYQVFYAVAGAGVGKPTITVTATAGTVASSIQIVGAEYTGCSGVVANSAKANTVFAGAAATIAATTSGNLLSAMSADSFGAPSTATASSGTFAAGIVNGYSLADSRGADWKTATGGSLTATENGSDGYNGIILVEYAAASSGINEEPGAAWPVSPGDAWIYVRSYADDTMQSPIYVEDVVGAPIPIVPEQLIQSPSQWDDRGTVTAFVEDVGSLPAWLGPEQWPWVTPPPDDSIQRGSLEEPGSLAPLVPEQWPVATIQTDDASAFGALDDAGIAPIVVQETGAAAAAPIDDTSTFRAIEEASVSVFAAGDSWVTTLALPYEDASPPYALDDVGMRHFVSAEAWAAFALAPDDTEQAPIGVDDLGGSYWAIPEQWAPAPPFQWDDYVSGLGPILGARGRTTVLAAPSGSTEPMQGNVGSTTVVPYPEGSTWPLSS